jgi:hypothetical protein
VAPTAPDDTIRTLEVSMTRTIRLLLMSLAVVATLAACTGASAAPSVASLDDPGATTDPNASPSPSAPTDPQEAFLAYAECMREHGIDMPDPQVSDEGGGKFSVGFSAEGRPDAADMDEMQAADEACRPLLENAIGEGGRPELSPEDEEAMLDFARCMREHGIDMPDPGEGGMVFQMGGPGEGTFDQDAFEAAQEACKDLLPGRVDGEGPEFQAGPGGGADGGANDGVTKSEEESK